MTFKIKEIMEKEKWEDFLLKCEKKTFLDSWNWGEFQKSLGNKIWRFGIYESEPKELLDALAFVIKIKARRGTFLLVPHGPSIPQENIGKSKQILEALLVNLKEVAKREKASFIRISPILEREEKNIKIFKELGFKKAPIHIHPELTWELNILSSEEELLMGMRKTTRYLIRQAQKNSDIEISQSREVEGIEEFYKIYRETVNRHRFIPFSLDYLKKEYFAFNPDNQIVIFIGKYREEVLSSAIIVFWQKAAFYHHGASSSNYPKVPVSYLLQWEVIKEAKRRGCRIYNFWGIAPREDIKHPWAGLSLFKKGFGGYRKEYLKTQDFPLSIKYWSTYFFEKLRKKKRGL